MVGTFEAAIAKDPLFAPAYSGLGAAYVKLGSVFGGAFPPDARANAIRAAEKAIELDPELAVKCALVLEHFRRHELAAGQLRQAEGKPRATVWIGTGRAEFEPRGLCQIYDI